MFIARSTECTSTAGSCGEMPAAPLVQNVERPRTRPGGFRLEEIVPDAGDSAGAQSTRERRRGICETRFQPFSQRSAQPFIPRQSKGAKKRSEEHTSELQSPVQLVCR